MNSFKDRQRKFSLRKLSVGVASVAIASFFLGGQVVSADETTATESAPAGVTAGEATEATPVKEAPLSSAALNIEESFGEKVAVVSEELIEGKTAGDIAAEEIATTLSQPVVEESVAKTGGLVKVETSQTEPVLTAKEEGNKATATNEVKITVTSTYKSDATVPLGVQKTETTSYTTSGVYETPSAHVTEREVVTKVTTVENVRVVETSSTDVVQGQNADVVFIVDTSGSMSGTIGGVIDNIKNFVNGLNQSQITTRLGLVGYGSRYEAHDFGGLLTTDSALFVERVTGLLRTDHGPSEDPTKPLNFIASDYDWSPEKDVARFAIVFTDEDIDVWADKTEDIKATTAALKAAKVATTFVYDIDDNDSRTEFTPIIEGTGGSAIDIKQDYSQTFTQNLTGWIITNVNTNTRYYTVVTEEYTLFVELVGVEKPTLTVKPTSAVKPVECPPTAKPVKASTLPKTGDGSTLGLTSLGFMSVMAALAWTAKKRKSH